MLLSFTVGKQGKMIDWVAVTRITAEVTLCQSIMQALQ